MWWLTGNRIAMVFCAPLTWGGKKVLIIDFGRLQFSTQLNMPDGVYTDNNLWMCEQACGASFQSHSLALTRRRRLHPTTLGFLSSCRLPRLCQDVNLLFSPHYHERCGCLQLYGFDLWLCDCVTGNSLLIFGSIDLTFYQLPDSIMTWIAWRRQHKHFTAPKHS